MKALVIILLAVIAAGVGYLAYNDYRQQKAVEDFAARIADPDGYVARKWADEANLECTEIRDVIAVDTPAGVKRPTEFTCYHSDTGSWRISDRACGDNEPVYANGPPRSEDQVYSPLFAICWDVKRSAP